jgi:hypothetical protein
MAQYGSTEPGMSHLVSRILLSIFMMPLAAIIYILAFVMAAEQSHHETNTICVGSGLLA